MITFQINFEDKWTLQKKFKSYDYNLIKDFVLSKLN